MKQLPCEQVLYQGVSGLNTKVEKREEKRAVNLQPASTQEQKNYMREPRNYVKETSWPCISDENLTIIRVGQKSSQQPTVLLTLLYEIYDQIHQANSLETLKSVHCYTDPLEVNIYNYRSRKKIALNFSQFHCFSLFPLSTEYSANHY
jgi:hypothetical protein